jgi:hypothetical protein
MWPEVLQDLENGLVQWPIALHTLINIMIAKFKVNSVTKFSLGQAEAKLSAVTSGSEENKSFNKYTPSGDLRIMIDNPAAVDFFEPGQDYLLEFKKA